MEAIYKIINIKQDMPDSDYAIHIMQKEIAISRFAHIPVVVVIHGYGSSGKGGTIKKRVQEELKDMQHYGKIQAFVTGDQWTEHNEVCQKILQICPDVELKEDLYLKNSGVTVILL